MKCQVAITEYLVLVFVIVLIIIFTMFLIFGWQAFVTGSERVRDSERRSLFLVQSLISSPALNDPNFKKGSVFDDGKLTVAECKDLEKIFGAGWYAEIKVLKDKPNCEVLRTWVEKLNCNNKVKRLRDEESIVCNLQNYPNCGIWKLCLLNKRDMMIYRSIPVNVHRKIDDIMELGVLTLGFPVGG